MSVKKVSSSKEVITSSEIQVLYEQLYTFLMEFLWEFPVVQTLANLEIAIFKRFPDKEEIQKYLRELKSDISSTYNELAEDDEVEFKETFEELEQAVEDFDAENTGVELYSVEEFIADDDVEATSDIEIPEEDTKTKFKIGDIKKTTKEERELQEEAMRTLSNPFENNEEET